MKKTYLKIGSLLVAGVLLAFAFGWVAVTNANAAEEASHGELSLVDAADSAAYRWHTQDRDLLIRATSGGISVDLTSLNAADVSAFRWNALARFYEAQDAVPRDLTSFDAADISAYRWVAMGKFYETQGALSSLDAADRAAYRWSFEESVRLLKATSQVQESGERLYSWPGH